MRNEETESVGWCGGTLTRMVTTAASLLFCAALGALADGPASLGGAPLDVVFADASPSVTDGPCTVPRRSAPLPLAEFRSVYKGRHPVVFPSPPSAAARSALNFSSLLAAYGELPVTLASSNAFSHAKRESTLSAYLRHHMAPVTPADRADKLWYLFGDTLKTEAWAPLHATFTLPLDAAADDPVVAWGVGGLHSGVPFHRHGAVYAESVLGSKRWWLAPPGEGPTFDGNATQLSFVLGGGGAGVAACTVREGEAIYIPSDWWHATLNLASYNAFTSVFVREV